MTTTNQTNNIQKNLKDQYFERVEYLNSKIEEQQKEIERLNELISLLTLEKNYDC